jgi:hypothetical protein
MKRLDNRRCRCCWWFFLPKKLPLAFFLLWLPAAVQLLPCTGRYSCAYVLRKYQITTGTLVAVLSSTVATVGSMQWRTCYYKYKYDKESVKIYCRDLLLPVQVLLVAGVNLSLVLVRRQDVYRSRGLYVHLARSTSTCTTCRKGKKKKQKKIMGGGPRMTCSHQ